MSEEKSVVSEILSLLEKKYYIMAPIVKEELEKIREILEEKIKEGKTVFFYRSYQADLMVPVLNYLGVHAETSGKPDIRVTIPINVQTLLAEILVANKSD